MRSRPRSSPRAAAAPVRQTRPMADGQQVGRTTVGDSADRVDQPVLRVRNVHKRFGAVQVLKGVDLELHRGEILALVGENGAGKSTLVQCIAQTSVADTGRVEMAGQPLAADPVAARDQGLAVVWQDLALCDNLTAVANLFLGNERIGGVFLDEFAMADEAQAPVRAAPHHHRRARTNRSGRCRAASASWLPSPGPSLRRPAVLVLDEPTAALGVTETQIVRAVAGGAPRCGCGRAARVAPPRPGLPARRPHRDPARGPHRRRGVAARGPPRRRGRHDLRGRGRLDRPPAATPPAQPRRPAGRGRAGGQPAPDRVGDGRGAWGSSSSASTSSTIPRARSRRSFVGRRPWG